MDTSPAVQYVRQRRATGASDIAIRQELRASGWEPAWVEQIIAEADGRASPSHSQVSVGGSGRRSRGYSARKILMITVVILVVLGVAATLLMPPLAKEGEKQVLTDNAIKVTQEQDILSLAASIADYQNANDGSLPVAVEAAGEHDLLLCNAHTCGAASYVYSASFTFDVRNVQMRAYEDGMQIADPSGIYLVPSAACNQDMTGLAASNSRSMAFLYHVQAGNITTQKCVSP